MKKRRDDNTLKVGSKVSFDFGGRDVIATVIEDRGNTGMGGRRMLRVRLDWEDMPEPPELEMPEVELRRIAT
jgi:hypothetical protein